jgi:hypothetical protein
VLAAEWRITWFAHKLDDLVTMPGTASHFGAVLRLFGIGA